MRVIADLHGGDLENDLALAEFQEIKDRVLEDVSVILICRIGKRAHLVQRNSGEDRSYTTMWRKYKRRVLLAMSSQAFAQLVRFFITLAFLAVEVFVRMESMVRNL